MDIVTAAPIYSSNDTLPSVFAISPLLEVTGKLLWYHRISKASVYLTHWGNYQGYQVG